MPDLGAIRVRADAAALSRLKVDDEVTAQDYHVQAHSAMDVPALLARIAELEADLERATNAWFDAKSRSTHLASAVRNALTAVTHE